MSRSIFALPPLLALLSTAAAAEDLTPEKLAEIQRAEQKAVDKVNEAHGNKPPTEMDNDERLQVAKEQQSATQKVLDEHGVTPKEYAQSSSAMSREEREQVEEAKRQLAIKEEQERIAKEKAAQEPAALDRPLVIKRGYGDEQPVNVDELDEVMEEESELASPDGASSGNEPGEAKAAAPAPKASKAKPKAKAKAHRR